MVKARSFLEQKQIKRIAVERNVIFQNTDSDTMHGGGDKFVGGG